MNENIRTVPNRMVIVMRPVILRAKLNDNPVSDAVPCLMIAKTALAKTIREPNN